MKISTEIIKSLNPCLRRFNNYVEHYSDFNGTLEDFVMLENITYLDKIWVITKLFTKEQNVKFAIKCASSVLNIFEERYPKDKRPRQALEAAENYLISTDTDTAAAADAAYAAAAYAAAAYAAAAADTAYAAATYAAAAAYAAYAAAYAATYAAAAAAYAATYAAYANPKSQQELNLIFAVEVANE